MRVLYSDIVSVITFCCLEFTEVNLSGINGSAKPSVPSRPPKPPPPKVAAMNDDTILSSVVSERVSE